MLNNHNEEHIFFSVIMPCYNSAAYVRDAVDSLIAQSYAYWNLIAVNDGSSDDTLNILNDYVSKDDRISVYSKENGGYSSAINYGLERISDDYFLMMGSDDRLAPDLFKKIVDNLNDNLPDMVAFRAVKFVNGKSIGVDDITDFDTFASLQNSTINDYRKKYPKHAEILFVRDTAKCYKTSILGDLRYFGKYGYDADGVFSSLFSHKCCSFMSIPVDGYYWTRRSDSVSAKAKNNLQIDLDRLSVWINYNQYVLNDNSYEPTKQEKVYLSMGHDIGTKLLTEIRDLDKFTKKKIHIARKYSIKAYKKFKINEYYPRGVLKKFLFVKTPNVWTAIVRMKNIFLRRKEEKK